MPRILSRLGLDARAGLAFQLLRPCFMRTKAALFSDKKYSGRKIARKISIKEMNHVIFKSSVPILRVHRQLIDRVIHDAQQRFGFKIRAIAVMPDHIHLAMKVPVRMGTDVNPGGG